MNENTNIPDWFSPELNQPAQNESPGAKRKPATRRNLLILVAAAILLLAGGVVWYMRAVHDAKVAAFREFETAYVAIEASLVDFSDITEPDDLAAKDLGKEWGTYLSALDKLAAGPLYQEYASLIDDIRRTSLVYELYTTQTLPNLMLYLTQCYIERDETMYSEPCLSHIQAIVDSGDSHVKQDATSLLKLLTQLSQQQIALTEQQTDAISELQEAMFSAGETVAEPTTAKVRELGLALSLSLHT